MVINEGVKVLIGGDNKSLISTLKGSKLAVGAFAAASAAAMAAVAKQSAQMAARLDRDLRNVAALGGEAAGNMQGLRREVMALGREYGRSFNELTQANYQAVSSGFTDIADSMEVLRAGTRLAIAGNGDLESSVSTVANVLNAYGESSDKAEKAAAQLFAIIRDGKFDAAQLGRFLTDIPSAAAATGIGLDEVGAALATMTALSGNASKAVDQFRQILIKFETEGIQGRNLEEKVRSLAQNGLAELKEMFGDEGAALGVLQLTQNLDMFEKNLAKSKDTVGSFAEAVETTNNGPLKEWERLGANAATVAIEIGSAINSVLTPALKSVNDEFDQILSSMFKAGAGKDIGAPVGSGGGAPTLTLRGGQQTRSLRQQFPLAFQPLIEDTLANRPGRGGRQRSNESQFGSPTDVVQFNPGDFGGTDHYTNRFDFPVPPFQEMAKTSKKATNSIQTANVAMVSFSNILQTMVAGGFENAGQRMMAVISQILSTINQLGGGAGFGLAGTAFGIASTLLGFKQGGYTGRGGIVHEDEFVFSSDAVRSMGLGMLERMHRTAAAGSTEYIANVTVNAGGGDAAAIASVTEDAVGRALRGLETTQRGNFYKNPSARYRRG